VRERLHFAVGALLHLLSGRPRALFDETLDIADDDTLAERLVAFLAAGFRAPAARTRSRQNARPPARRIPR
jgi:hypothetical protein